MARFLVLSEIERNGIVYVPKGREPYTTLERTSVLKSRRGEGYEVKSIRLQVDRSGFITLKDGEVEGLLKAGSIAFKPVADTVSEQEAAERARERSKQRLGRVQKTIDARRPSRV